MQCSVALKEKVEREDASAEVKPRHHLGDIPLGKEICAIKNDMGLQDSPANIEEIDGEAICSRTCHNEYAKRCQ